MRQRVSWMWLLLASVVISMAFAVAAGAATGSFEDDEGSVHEPAIEALAGKGVLAGTECESGSSVRARSSVLGSWRSGSRGC